MQSTSIPVGKGTLERYANFPTRLIPPRHVDVWLPEGYSQDQRYAVLYMHDGQMLFDPDQTWNGQEWGVDEVLSGLIEKGSVPPCIVVGIWNRTDVRYSDYFPQKAFESLPRVFQDSMLSKAKRTDGSPLFTTPVQSDAYLRFLVKELKPFIDSHYATYPDREHTFIMGSSMGGLISMYALCEYPDVFAGAGCLSTHWPGCFFLENNPIPAAFQRYLQDHLPPPANHRLYFDLGTETLDAWYEPFQLAVDSIMEHQGYRDSLWVTRKFTGHAHDEASWRKRLHIPLQFLMVGTLVD